MPDIPAAVEQADIALEVNGRRIDIRVPVRLLLVDLLREYLGLTGTHIGCEHGVCGVCTVMMDGAAVRSCLVLAIQADARGIQTVEALATDGHLSQMQEAFSTHHALQCGFCTPGILMTLRAESPDDWQGEDSIRELLSGNLCRCTGYAAIVEAVMTAWSSDPAKSTAP